jgi:hypothetical protein
MFAEYRPTAEDAQLLESPWRHFKVMRCLRSSEIDGVFFVRFQHTLTPYLCLRATMMRHCPVAALQRPSVHGSGKIDENVIAVYQDGTSSVDGFSGVRTDNADAYRPTIQQCLSLPTSAPLMKSENQLAATPLLKQLRLRRDLSTEEFPR